MTLFLLWASPSNHMDQCSRLHRAGNIGERVVGTKINRARERERDQS